MNSLHDWTWAFYDYYVSNLLLHLILRVCISIWWIVFRSKKSYHCWQIWGGMEDESINGFLDVEGRWIWAHCMYNWNNELSREWKILKNGQTTTSFSHWKCQQCHWSQWCSWCWAVEVIWRVPIVETIGCPKPGDCNEIPQQLSYYQKLAYLVGSRLLLRCSCFWGLD